MPLETLHLHRASSTDEPPLPWAELKFNPVGLYNLRKRIELFPKQPGIFAKYQERFLASDIAWFAAGASDDDNHHVKPDTFHELFKVCRENLPIGRQGHQLWTSVRQNLRQLTFDLATTWDRAYGGSTLIVHVEGTTIPGAPLLPEFLKADVYIPPHLLIEQPDCKQTIAEIVQVVIEKIGIPTAKRWREAAHGIGWSLSQKGPIITPSDYFPHLIPPPVRPGSASYIFRGRPFGSLPQLISSPDASSTTSSLTSHTSESSASSSITASATLASIDRYFPEEFDPEQLALIDATEKIAYLEERIEQADQKENEYLAKITALHNELVETFSVFWKREHDQLTPMSPSRHASTGSTLTSPQTSPGYLKSATKLNFPTVDISMFPRPYLAQSQSRASDLSSVTPRTPVTLKANQKRKADSTVVPDLGPAAVECITALNLTHLFEMVALIVKHNPPPLWGTRLATISISDSDRDDLLKALAVDWEADATMKF